MHKHPKLKVCGVTTQVDLQMCCEQGVDSIGINLWTGSRRGLTLEQASELVANWPSPTLERVGVFVDAAPEQVLKWHQQLAFDLIQPHGERPYTEFVDLGIPVVWVVRGTPPLDELADTAAAHPGFARILLDAAVAGYGGAGKQTDWVWARRAVQRLSVHAPVWLAGGIRPDNAQKALQQVLPAGLDVASGAEFSGAARGQKDPQRVAALVAACRHPN